MLMLLTLCNYPGIKLLLLKELLKNGLFEDCWLKLFRLFPVLNAGDDVGNVRDAETEFVNPESMLPCPKLLIFVPVITFPWGEPYASWLEGSVCA